MEKTKLSGFVVMNDKTQRIYKDVEDYQVNADFLIIIQKSVITYLKLTSIDVIEFKEIKEEAL
jgi:hypothetical protein